MSGAEEELQNTVYMVMFPFRSRTGSSAHVNVTCLVSMLAALKEGGEAEGAGGKGERMTR